MEAATKPGALRTDSVRRQGRIRRLTTETKQAFKTTEFWGMVGVIAAILISAAVIKGGDTRGTDEFIARQAWLVRRDRRRRVLHRPRSGEVRIA